MSETFVEKKINEAGWLKSQPDERVAFDIGANCGHYSRMLAERFGRVFAFEPHPVNVKGMQDGTLPSNVILKQMAISNITGECKLYTQPDSMNTGHSISPKMLGHPVWRLEENRYMMVPCITIDDFCEENNLFPSFIKCDIEGGEDMIWDGAIKTLSDNDVKIVLELHSNVDWPRLNNLFYNLGYKITCDEDPETEMGNSRHFFIEKE